MVRFAEPEEPEAEPMTSGEAEVEENTEGRRGIKNLFEGIVVLQSRNRASSFVLFMDTWQIMTVRLPSWVSQQIY